jgi:NADPH-ferrihemoprotein reductase
MAELDTLDIVVLVVLLLATTAYFTKGTYWGQTEDKIAKALAAANGAAKSAGTRSIVEKLDEMDKNCVMFYGSQTGTAEDYASRLAKEGQSRYGLRTMTADLEEFEYEDLDNLPDDKVAFFVMATYGEGEPTDNAVDFMEFIGNEDSSFSKGSTATDQPLTNVKYVTFGLGNNTYEHYNEMVRRLDKNLTKLGANRIGTAGEGDDGAGTMEEDFLAWKEEMWAELAKDMGLMERDVKYEPSFEVLEQPEMDATHDTVYLGEPNKHHLEGKSKGPYNSNNPFIAPITESKELFSDKTRNCIHAEIDISESNLKYETGDHIAIWPTNAGKEVERLLKILNLSDKRHMVISVKNIDPTSKLPFPSPTTYDAVLRYHMEICAPVSRQFCSILAQFAPDTEIKREMAKLGGDKEYFHQQVTDRNINIAQLLEIMTDGKAWSGVPFSLMIETLHKLQPRYYSISSSSHVQPQRISITAVVESIEKPGAPHIVKGVTTNYILALKQRQHGDPDPDPHGLNYAIDGPRNKYDGIHVPVHVRHSNFKLPSNPATPVIMVGPGTGVAPFRGFVQERAARARAGETVGKTILFFGCRNSVDDFMYKDEWEVSPNITRRRKTHMLMTSSNISKIWETILRSLLHSPEKVLRRRTYSIS